MEFFTNLISNVESGVVDIFAENTATNYIVALSTAAIGTLILFIIRFAIRKILNRPFIMTHQRIKYKLLKKVFSRLFTLLHIVPFFLAMNMLKMPPELHRILEISFYVIFLFCGVRFASVFIAFAIDFFLRRAHARVDPSTGKALLPIVNIILWTIAVTFLLDNLGFEVSTIIAGLGIMGVAVGLAGQAILADFFSYLVILIDKPFQIGELVSLNGTLGTVERIGLKTTRLRSLTNEEIIISNSDMTKGVLQNYYDIAQRRIRLVFPLPFGIPPAKIEEISCEMQKIVESQADCEFGRAVLLDFGPWFMNFELLYTVKRGDLNQALDVQHKINLKALEYLESQDIALAVPPVPNITPGNTTGALS